MARKKIELPIEGFGKDPEDKLTVQKSIPLFALWRSGLTLAEFKIMDTYLSRIDSHNPDKRTVIFTKGELEGLLGLKQIKPEVLDERLKHLQETTVNLSSNGKKIDRITLFERAQAEQDDYGQWTARLTCTPSAMKYIFNIEELGYLRYKLRSVIKITSFYSYVLFTYLERNRFRKSWDVPLDELKATLNCDGEELYKEYKRFNERILKRCHKELREKTECRFTYEPIRTGRKVTAIQFTLETLASLEEPTDNDQLSLFDTETAEPADQPDDRLEFLRSVFAPRGFGGIKPEQEPEFSREEIEQIFAILATIPKSKLPENVEGRDIWFRRYHYLSERYAAMNRIDTRKPIKHRFAYFVKMLKADAGTE